MSPNPRVAVVISASSGIGAAIANHWTAGGWKVLGTYRTTSSVVDDLRAHGVEMEKCDLADSASVAAACRQLHQRQKPWDVLAICPGSMEPIGPFAETNFDQWERSFAGNFTAQLRLVRELLPDRNRNSPQLPCVIFFAGGGANSAPVNYSAYTISKIALTKMCELLDAEIPDVRFVIVGPGWVRTKIHDQTLRAGAAAGEGLQRTSKMLAGEQGWTAMEDVVRCCDWLVDAPRKVIGGRNFSVAHDAWGNPALAERLAQDPAMYKLRRSGNDWRPK